jgi:hypothetical protein
MCLDVVSFLTCVKKTILFPTSLVLVRKISEGGHWANVQTCSFLHERCNYSHVTSSNWTQPSFKLMQLYKLPKHVLRIRQVALRTE